VSPINVKLHSDNSHEIEKAEGILGFNVKNFIINYFIDGKFNIN
jgi:hypothetical protein